jgi:hypothetical protein
MAADARSFLNQVHLESGRGQIQGSLDTADTAADNHNVSKIAAAKIFRKLLQFLNWQYVVSQFLSPHPAFRPFVSSAARLNFTLLIRRLDHIVNDFCYVFDFQDILILKVKTALLKIGDTIRTGRCQHLGADLPGLFQPDV